MNFYFEYVNFGKPNPAAFKPVVVEKGLTVEDMARAFPCSRDKIYNLINAGIIPARKSGNSWVITITAWNTWFAAYMANPKLFHSTARPKAGSISSKKPRVKTNHTTRRQPHGVKGQA
jgi:excisionase family DNA binding protein